REVNDSERGRVLVTGGAGAMGRRLVRGLHDAGWPTRALVLPADPHAAQLRALGCEVVEGDVRDRGALDAACRGVQTVYHLAAVIVEPDPAVLDAVNR